MTNASAPSPLPTLRNQDWLDRPETRAVFDALAQAGHEARVVGGAVRNALMGRPVEDVDIATPARPDQVMEAAAAAGLHSVPTGADHGTVTVISGHIPYQITTLREDVESYGRHAKVAFSTDWAADARRRDFTMNALYCAADGTVSDPLGGYGDIVRRRVIFIGDAHERIREDYLRILRFFRFHAEYAESEPDRAALDACVSERGGLAGLSAERVRTELLRLLAAPNAQGAVATMHDFGLLAPILGAAPRLGLLERLIAREQSLQASRDALLRLSVLAVAVAEDIDRIAQRLRLSTAERESLLVVDHRTASLFDIDTEAAQRAFYRAASVELWHRLVLAAAAASPAVDDAVRRLWELPDRWPLPRFPLRGADALQLGMAPGPQVGETLRELESWWIENGFSPDEPALRERLARMIRPQ